MKYYYLGVLLISVAAIGQGPTKDIIDTANQKKVDPSVILNPVVPNPTDRKYSDLEKTLTTCESKFGIGLQPDGEKNPQKLEKCAMAEFKKFYLPTIKKLFSNYESKCEVNCGDSQGSSKAQPNH